MPIQTPDQVFQNQAEPEEAERAYTATKAQAAAGNDDDDLDEPLPARQESCSLDGGCESCQ